jgi:superfamily II DNA or RNA helicase
MQLRPYQLSLIEEVKTKFIKGKKRVILCAPTGSGKTVIFTKVVIDTLQKDMFARVLIITDRIELVKQTFKSLHKAGAEPSLYNAQISPKKIVTDRCVVGMVETIKRRHKAGTLHLGNFKLIIIDEAHKGNFKAIFEIWPDAFYIGATATPIATTKKDPLKNYFDDIALKVDIPDLIPDGYLSQAKSIKMVAVDESQLKMDNRTGDFTDKSLSVAFDSPKVYEGAVEMYEKHCKGKKTIIFCVNIATTMQLARMLNAYAVTSESTKDEREWNLAQFHESKDGIMVNCGILTTGYDHPAIEAVIMLRATASLPLWLQCCGRGSRVYPNKDYFTIIDMGDNINRLGKWEDTRAWDDWFFNPEKARDGVAPVKECPSCQALLHTRVMECQFCGHIFEEKEKEYLKGVDVEVDPIPNYLKNRYIVDLTPKELHEIAQIRKYKFSFITRVCRAKGIDFMLEYGRTAGYKNGWHKHHLTGDTKFNNFKII